MCGRAGAYDTRPGLWVGGVPERGDDGRGAGGVVAEGGAGAAGEGEALRAAHVDVHRRHVPRHNLCTARGARLADERACIAAAAGTGHWHEQWCVEAATHLFFPPVEHRFDRVVCVRGVMLV
jgi:hypothetical protein